ncbi:hypothetical protein DPMN_084014 [Dreissena polymorpha]|uniref:Uncharacterized protein n=1 Tax=Dreissena polymorpha TaxID=45954 RepID=A0A9D3YDS9_DREPO|nr:hypothetical protein DPMN_084013 [Dreissena polymorpha]KAH3696543.1 hypothetical protein DPMN_084014 [Dreissena polymorpha]
MLEEATRQELPPEGFYGGLIFDEMSIQSDVQLCKNGDVIELIGLVDLGEEGNISNTLRKGKK